MEKPRICTVGHGTRALEELAETLRQAGVTRLVDVRRFPGSRRNPQFSRGALETALPARGIAYEWWGEALGGRRSGAKGAPSRHPAWRVDAFRAYADYMDTPVFRNALARLADMARGETVAVLCAETLWWSCHRRLIADAMDVEGFEVLHLLGPGKQQPHARHPALRVDAAGLPVYDVGTDGTLPFGT